MSPEANMKIEPRSYRDESDLAKMYALLRAGSAAANGTFYAQVGDVNWWLYYPPFEGEIWPHLSLWDDPSDPECLLAWSVIDPNWGAFDVYVQPELRRTPLAEEIYIWAEEHTAAILRAAGQDTIRANYISQNDDVVIARLLARGFQRTQEDAVCMIQSLDGLLLRPALPDGYTVRGSKGEIEVAVRATAQYNAFTNTAPFDIYVERFRRFMRSPVYDPETDVVAVSPDGRIGSFCIVWPDPVTGAGLFEPVGTHPDFRQRGLGKAVMIEALHRLKDRGMNRAIVCTLANNTPGIKLYEAAGFCIIDRMGTYEKKLD
jgi:ribosomal protein S18 acetylase RimI-like enzyme